MKKLFMKRLLSILNDKSIIFTNVTIQDGRIQIIYKKEEEK